MMAKAFYMTIDQVSWSISKKGDTEHLQNDLNKLSDWSDT
jgi:hypothetical protein